MAVKMIASRAACHLLSQDSWTGGIIGIKLLR